MDREALFQLLMKKDWDRLSEQLYAHRRLLGQDPVLQQVARLFETEFIGHVQGLPPRDLLHKVRHITLVISSERKRFAESFWRPVIEMKLRAMYELKDPALPGVANDFPDLPLARDLMQQLRQERPEELADARRSALNIKAASAPARHAQATHVASLFKSPQELAFYQAMCRVMADKVVYPNVAASTALSFQAFKDKLSQDAQDYFFRAVFDCVVFDPADGFRASHFFELDSSFHNTPEAIARDRLKDRICTAAGVKLLRLRAFEQLIRELAPDGRTNPT